MFLLFLIISSFIWRHLFASFPTYFIHDVTFHLSSHPPSTQFLAHLPMSLFLICLLRFLFILFLHHLQSNLPPGSLFPPLLIFSIYTICVCNTWASFSESDIILRWLEYCPKNNKFVFVCYSLFVDHTSRNHERVPLMS